MPEQSPSRPPRDDLVRAQRGGYELRASDSGGPPLLRGHFAVFDQWTEIESAHEGHFMERIAPGAFAKSFSETHPSVTFNHGHDPHLGDKVLGDIEVLREDDEGAYYEVALYDGLDPLLLSGLRAGSYGASFRFGVMREDFVRSPERSDHNPEGLPERTVREARVPEFGPVTFPAYAGATAGVRSLTDEFVFSKFTSDPRRLSNVIDYVRGEASVAATADHIHSHTVLPDPHHNTSHATTGYLQTSGTSTPVIITTGGTAGTGYTTDTNFRITSTPSSAGAPPHPAASSPAPAAPQREEEPAMPETEQTEYRTRDEKVTRIGDLKAEVIRMANDNGGVMSDADSDRWNETKAELGRLEADVAAYDERMAFVEKVERTDDGGRRTEPERAASPGFNTRHTLTESEVYDRAAVYRDARSPEDAAVRFRDRARRAIELTTFPHERANQEDQRGHVEQLVLNSDSPDAETARRILITGSPTYRRAFGKALLAGSMDRLSHEERTVMAEGAGATGGFAITFDLDPTIVRTSSGVVNPFRAACKVVSISGTNEWRAVSSGAVVATYEAEATEAVDRSPTLAQPAFVTQRAQTFIPFSIELDQDWGSLQGEMAGLIQDSKDTLEAAQFAVGVGTTVFPQGITVGATATATSGTTTVLAVNDIYKTEEALGPRFRPNAQWFANRFIYNKVRQLDTAGGANLWVPRLSEGLANTPQGNTGYNLIGYPANEASGMAASLATTTKLAVLGDPNFYVIVERVGLDIELIPHLFGITANYPSGQRALYAMWRNTGRVLNPAGFVTLVGL